VLRKYSNKKDENLKVTPGGAPAPQLIPAELGVNRFAWDFATEALPEVTGVFAMGDLSGHRVAPGRYKTRVKFKGETSETEFDLVGDPNLKAASEDWNAQQQIIRQAEEGLTEVHNSVNNMRKVKKQLEGYNELLKNDEQAKEIINAGKEILKKIEKWENNLIEPRMKTGQDVVNYPGKLGAEFLHIRSIADSHDPRVTQGVKERFADVQADWAKHKKTMQEIISKDINSYNKLFKDKNLPALITEIKEVVINN